MGGRQGGAFQDRRRGDSSARRPKRLPRRTVCMLTKPCPALVDMAFVLQSVAAACSGPVADMGDNTQRRRKV